MQSNGAIWGREYARVLGQAFSGNVAQLAMARRLVDWPRVDAEAALLDAHSDRVARFVDAVDAATQALGPQGFLVLQAAAHRSPVTVQRISPRSYPGASTDVLADAVSVWLLSALKRWPENAMRLAVATGRLLEEASALSFTNRRKVPLGQGFDELKAERLWRRVQLLARGSELVDALTEYHRLLLEAPGEGVVAIERRVGFCLSDQDRRWIETERLVGMLNVSGSLLHKTENGHIRRFVRSDVDHRLVLDSYGAIGHWLVLGSEDPRILARAGTLAARASDEQRPGTHAAWRALVMVGDGAAQDARQQTERNPSDMDDGNSSRPRIEEAHELRRGRCSAEVPSLAEIRQALSPARVEHAASLLHALRTRPRAQPVAPRRRSYVLEVTCEELRLRASSAGGAATPLARTSLEPADDELLAFFDVIARVCESAVIHDRIRSQHARRTAVEWTRVLLSHTVSASEGPQPTDLAGLNVKLVYVPASREHPLGGLPLIGLRYVADRLERLGARAEVITMPARELLKRRIELLGADVIGLSVYISNERESARLVKLLREAGFAGKIVLGGPQLREIEAVQDVVEGWDALIRGEGEEVLPQVLRVLADLDAGEHDRGLALARTLSGVAIAHEGMVILADTAARNAAADITCPLPFSWGRYSDDRVLKMNFTRGCPYACGFCPNHQGRKIHSSEADEMWRFTELAAADALRLPKREEERRASVIQQELGIDGPPRLKLALDVLLRRRVQAALFAEICGVDAPSDGPPTITSWQAKEMWLSSKAALLGSAIIVEGPSAAATSTASPVLERFELMTSEDNTLANTRKVSDYMLLRRASGLARGVVFNPGQNTVRDLTDRNGGINEAYLSLLCEDNPFKVVLGVDGSSNPVLRANMKPLYSIGEAVALNRALIERGVEVHNNYILLSPETTLLEAVEAFALFVILPLRWRDHGEYINLRITKEPGTRSHDEGLLFAPGDTSYNDPFRFAELDELVRRHRLTDRIASRDLAGRLWRILAEDREASRLLPLVVRRWERDFDGDPFLLRLAAQVRALETPELALVETLRQVAKLHAQAWPREPEAPSTPTAPEITMFEPSRGRRKRRLAGPAPKHADREIAGP